MANTRWNGPKFLRNIAEHLQRLRKHPKLKVTHGAELKALRDVKTSDIKMRRAIDARIKQLRGTGHLQGILTGLKALERDMKDLPEYQAKPRRKKATAKGKKK